MANEVYSPQPSSNLKRTVNGEPVNASPEASGSPHTSSRDAASPEKRQRSLADGPEETRILGVPARIAGEPENQTSETYLISPVSGSSIELDESRASSPYPEEDDDDDDDDGSLADFPSDEDNVLQEPDQSIFPGHSMADEDIMVAQVMLEGHNIEISRSLSEIVIKIPLSHLDPLARAACGLTLPEPLHVILNVSQGYKQSSPGPWIRVQHGDPHNPNGKGIVTSTRRTNPAFPMGLQISQALSLMLRQRWSRRGESMLSDACLLIFDRVNNAGNSCMMCDTPLAFPGVKPTVCEKSLCAFQLETMGLGADLSLFDTDTETADLLITAAVAACQDLRRSALLQFDMPLRKSLDGPDTAWTCTEFSELMNRLPTAEELRDAGPTRRKSLLSEIDPEASFVTSWIFATARAHVVSLPKDKHFQMMNTPHQFQIHTSTRPHAERFEALKSKHGSLWAWHGSSMSNWHNILRKNLKNASNTPLMSAADTGAAYGEGIYLAAHSSTSAGYSRMSNAWHQSLFGENPMCLALVEVANSSRVHHHMNGSIIVASDEDATMLRYLFIYPGGGIPPVAAKDMHPKRFRNDATIAYGSIFEEVEKSGKLLITSDEYFWDIDEVVGMIAGKNGLFINGYTNQYFAPVDIEAILSHRSGAGSTLQVMEANNVALRKRISPLTMARLNQVGRICRDDCSVDFAPSLAAVAELREWIDTTLSATEKQGLERAPFDATDSHTRQPFRDTVMHEIELVSSGGDCVHRFGDFLSQLKL